MGMVSPHYVLSGASGRVFQFRVLDLLEEDLEGAPVECLRSEELARELASRTRRLRSRIFTARSKEASTI